MEFGNFIFLFYTEAVILIEEYDGFFFPKVYYVFTIHKNGIIGIKLSKKKYWKTISNKVNLSMESLSERNVSNHFFHSQITG